MPRYHGTFSDYVGRLTAKVVARELRCAFYHVMDRTMPAKLAARAIGTKVVSTYRRHHKWGAPVKKKRRRKR